MKRINTLLLLLFLITGLAFAQDISNDFCSFSIPDSMEIEGEFYSEFKSALEMDSSEDALYKIVLQQKGLNAAMEDIGRAPLTPFDDYCRIIITCKEWSGGLPEGLSDEDLAFLDNLYYEVTASLYSLPEWNGVKQISFKGYPALLADYVRGSVSGNGDVHVYNITVSSENYDWTIIFAAREENLSKWLPVFREFGESFTFINSGINLPKDDINEYSIPATSSSFYWFTPVDWETEYAEGVKTSYFADDHYSPDGMITLAISTMDLQGMVNDHFGKLGFLYGSQRQITEAASASLLGFDFRIMENSIDSRNATFTYRYEYSMGNQFEGLIHYWFDGNTLIALSAEWDKGYEDGRHIVELNLDK